MFLDPCLYNHFQRKIVALWALAGALTLLNPWLGLALLSFFKENWCALAPSMPWTGYAIIFIRKVVPAIIFERKLVPPWAPG